MPDGPAISQTRVRLVIAPTIVHVPVPGTGTPKEPGGSEILTNNAGTKAQGEFVSAVLASGTTPATGDPAPDLLPDRTVVETARNVSPEETLWHSAANSAGALSEYLAQYPNGAHAGDARLRLAALDSAKRMRDENAVIAVLAEYSRAWNARDLDDIRALRPGLATRTLKEELSAARSITMQIHPIGTPKIEGDRATIECLHRVDQMFDDGTEKQSPGVHMTYVLVKRGGSWLIADTR